MRRKNLLYKLRRQGVRVDSRSRIIEQPAGTEIRAVQAAKLVKEYDFTIQIVIT